MKKTYDGYLAALEWQNRVIAVNEERLRQAWLERDYKEVARLNTLINLLGTEKKELRETIAQMKKWVDARA